MGMRQNIELSYANESCKIYIYSHWEGDELLTDSGLAKALADALYRRVRWDDEAYLARIIISEVIADAMGKETGYGISPYEIGSEFPTIKVNLDANRVNDMTFEEFLEHMEAARF